MSAAISRRRRARVELRLADHVEAEITYTEPGIKGDTATNTLKPATTDTGVEIRVPLFIDIGDFVKVDTRNKEYVERVKSNPMAHSVERLEQRLEVQDYKLNALLDVTQGISARHRSGTAGAIPRDVGGKLGIHRLVLYANDNGWKCLLSNGVAGEIPAVLEASFDAGGQVRLHSSKGNEEFDVVIPVLHNGAIAYLLAGDTEEGTG